MSAVIGELPPDPQELPEPWVLPDPHFGFGAPWARFKTGRRNMSHHQQESLRTENMKTSTDLSPGLERNVDDTTNGSSEMNPEGEGHSKF